MTFVFTRSQFLRFAETLAYAAAGAAVLGLAGLPAGWLSGAIVGVSAAALSGRPVYIPTAVGRVIYIVLGISLGSSVTPETVATMVTWPLSMVALAIAMVAITTSVMAYLKFVHGWPTLDALFAAAPGALAQAMALAQDTGANVRAIAMVQTAAARRARAAGPDRDRTCRAGRCIGRRGLARLSLPHAGRVDRRRDGSLGRAAW